MRTFEQRVLESLTSEGGLDMSLGERMLVRFICNRVLETAPLYKSRPQAEVDLLCIALRQIEELGFRGVFDGDKLIGKYIDNELKDARKESPAEHFKAVGNLRRGLLNRPINGRFREIEGD